MHWYLENIVCTYDTGINSVITQVCLTIQNVTETCADRQKSV